MSKPDTFFVKKIMVTANGHTYPQWKVEGRINGVRHRKFFSERTDADGHKAQMEIQALNDTQIVRTTVSHLPPEQLRDAEAALLRLKGKGTLVNAVDWFLSTHHDTLTKLTCAQALTQFLADRTPHLRPATLRDYEATRIGKLKDRSGVIDLNNGVIRITPAIAKTKDVRQITIQPNLAAWLKRYPLTEFPLLPKNAGDRLHEIRTKFGIGHDVLRHTFISMHIGKFRSKGDTALQAGNSEDMIKKHYLNLVTTAEAETFWAIVPATKKATSKKRIKPKVEIAPEPIAHTEKPA